MLLYLMLFASTDDENRFLESSYWDCGSVSHHTKKSQPLVAQKSLPRGQAEDLLPTSVDDAFEALVRANAQAKREADLLQRYRNGEIGSDDLGDLYNHLKQEGTLPARRLFLTEFGEVVTQQDILRGSVNAGFFDDSDEMPIAAGLWSAPHQMTGKPMHLTHAPEYITSEIPPDYVCAGARRLPNGQWIGRDGQPLPRQDHSAATEEDVVPVQEQHKPQVQHTKTSALTQRTQETEPAESINFSIRAAQNGAALNLQKGGIGVGLQWDNMGSFIEYFVNTTLFGHKTKQTIEHNGRTYSIKREADGPWYRDDVEITVKDVATGKKVKIYVRHRYFDKQKKIQKKDIKAIEEALGQLIQR